MHTNTLPYLEKNKQKETHKDMNFNLFVSFECVWMNAVYTLHIRTHICICIYMQSVIRTNDFIYQKHKHRHGTNVSLLKTTILSAVQIIWPVNFIPFTSHPHFFVHSLYEWQEIWNYNWTSYYLFRVSVFL